MSVFYGNAQEDVTAKAEIYANDELLSTSEFTTQIPNTYVIKAVYQGITSNTVTITAASGETAEGITLVASKSALYPDGGDFIDFALKDQQGNDVTELGTIYADNESLEDKHNRFSTTQTTSPVKITAQYMGNSVGNTVTVSVSKSYEFTSRLLLEDITRTNCPNCPQVINLIEELREDANPRVVPYSIHNSDSYIYKAYYSPETQQFADAFCDLVKVDYTVAPKVYLNRSANNIIVDLYPAQTLREEALNGPKDVAVALDSSHDPATSKITATVTVGSKKDFQGKIVVVLVENGIMASQTGYDSPIEMYRIMRAYAPSVQGEPKDFKSGVATTYTATFDSKIVENVNNCEVIAFVTDNADGLCENVQFAKIGEAKGY